MRSYSVSHTDSAQMKGSKPAGLPRHRLSMTVGNA